jgi:hypothetical protein
MPEAVDHKGYPVSPRDLTKTAWFYEQAEGLVVCQQPAEGVDAVTVTIPWRRLEGALNRHHHTKSKSRKE